MSNTRWVQITLAIWQTVLVASFALRFLGPVASGGFLRGMERAAGQAPIAITVALIALALGLIACALMERVT